MPLLTCIPVLLSRLEILFGSSGDYYLVPVWDEHILHRFPRSPLVVTSAVHWPPHIMVTRSIDGVLTLSLAMGNVMQVLSQKLNFTWGKLMSSVLSITNIEKITELTNDTWDCEFQEWTLTYHFSPVCRYSVITPEDQSWGSEGPNGSWTGMVGQVVEKASIHEYSRR